MQTQDIVIRPAHRVRSPFNRSARCARRIGVRIVAKFMPLHTLAVLLLFALAPLLKMLAYPVGTVRAFLAQSASYAVALNPQSYPTLEQFAANIAAVLGKIEVIEQELYDRLIYPTAGIQQLQFFTTPKGAGNSSETAAAAAVKSDADTNMTQNGQLPAPQAFWIDNIQVDVDPGSVATANVFTTQQPFVSAAAPAAATGVLTGDTDKWAVLNSAWLQLIIGQKPYYQNGPLSYFPPRAQKRMDAAVGGNSATTANFAAKVPWIAGGVRTLDPGLGLATGFNFQVNINWPNLVATPSGFNARVKCMLGGWLFRAAQ